MNQEPMSAVGNRRVKPHGGLPADCHDRGRQRVLASERSSIF
jgi:hypothetical protein